MNRSVLLITIALVASAAALASEAAFGRLPMRFEPDGRSGFVTAGVNFDFRFAPGRIEFHTATGSFSMALPGSNRGAPPSGYFQLPGRSNYFAGSGPEFWRTNVPHYAGVKYREIQPGVDLLFYGNGTELEFDFHLKPGARPERIRIGFDGADSLSVDDAGALVVGKGDGKLRFRRPVSYQLVRGQRREVASGFRVTPDGDAAFEIGEYNQALPLVIDPVLAFSAVIGPGNVSSVAVDSKGDIYVGGQRLFPGQTSNQSAFVAKVSGDGSTLIYTTFYGAPGNSGPAGIAVDDLGQAVIAGTAFGSIPIVNAVQPTRRGQDAYIAKLSADGASFVFSTYFGGTGQEISSGVILDKDGSIVATGTSDSSDLPVTEAIQPAPRWRSLYRTTDGGATWEVSSHGTEGADLSSVAIDPAEPGRVYAVGRGGLYSSVDRGGHWKKNESLPCERATYVVAHPADGQGLYAICSYGPDILKSVDAGSTWQRLSLPSALSQHLRSIRKLVIDPSTPSTIYAQSPYAVIKSVDSGATWTRIDNGPVERQLPLTFSDFALDPRDPSTLYVILGDDLWNSSNGGATWNPVPSLVGRTTALTVDSSNSTVYAAGYSGADRVVFKSGDKGATWSMSAPLPEAFLVQSLLATSKAIFAMDVETLFRSLDGGSSWEPFEFSRLTLREIAADPADSSQLYLASTEPAQRAFLLKLSPNGQTTRFATYLGPNHPAGVAADPSGDIYVAGMGVGLEQPLYRLSESDCLSWRRIPIFVTKLASDGQQAIYSSCLDMASSGTAIGVSRVNGIAVDETGSAYVIGATTDSDFPLISPIQSRLGGYSDGFLLKLNSSGDLLPFSTFLGGVGLDEPLAITSAGRGRVALAGRTDSRNFPVTQEAIQPAMRGARWHEIIFPPFQSARARFGQNAFVAVIDTNEPRLAYSSYLGGSRFDQALAVAVDTGGRIIVAGEATSRDFPKGETPPGADEGGQGIFLSKIDLGAQPLLPDLRAVTDAASFLSGRISASEIITLFGDGLGPSPGVSFRLDELGQLPLTLGGTRVLIDGSPIPLLYVSAGQINAIAPGTLSAAEIVTVEVETGGATSSPYRVEVGPAAPGIFTLSGAGLGPAAALNQDLGVNSPANPAARGSVIVLYATGPGPSDTPFSDRQLTPLTPPWPAPTGEVAVLIGDQAAKLLYAGAAPGLVPGVLQINAEIPMEVSPGPGVPVGLSIGGVWSDPSPASPKPTIAVE